MAYPENWREIACAVKDEAGWTCARCGHEHHYESGHVLTVHHFDGDKANCERWNLMPLCQRCHLSVQGRVNPEVPLMFHPSPWAMPYIAGFYEAGRGVPGPTYDLVVWCEIYEEAMGRVWPDWAPQPQEASDGSE